MATQSQYPTTVEDLVKSPWYQKLKTLVKNFRLNEPLEDTLGDIFVAMLEKEYLSRWSPKAGSYSNWVYTFAANVCKKKYNRSNSKGGRAIEGAATLQSTSNDNEDSVIGIFFEERLNAEQADDRGYDYNLLVEEIEKILSAYPAYSSNTHEGVTYQRDMKTVFSLLKDEFQPKEIAVLFDTSVEFIYTLIRRMRPIIVKVI